jgi:hypothetical protein
MVLILLPMFFREMLLGVSFDSIAAQLGISSDQLRSRDPFSLALPNFIVLAKLCNFLNPYLILQTGY